MRPERLAVFPPSTALWGAEPSTGRPFPDRRPLPYAPLPRQYARRDRTPERRPTDPGRPHGTVPGGWVQRSTRHREDSPPPPRRTGRAKTPTAPVASPFSDFHSRLWRWPENDCRLPRRTAAGPRPPCRTYPPWPPDFSRRSGCWPPGSSDYPSAASPSHGRRPA